MQHGGHAVHGAPQGQGHQQRVVGGEGAGLHRLGDGAGRRGEGSAAPGSTTPSGQAPGAGEVGREQEHHPEGLRMGPGVGDVGVVVGADAPPGRCR